MSSLEVDRELKAEYKRDLNHIYLIIRGISLETESYQVRMLAGNSVPSILNCRIVNVDSEYLLYFDITSKQKLTSYFEDRQLDHKELLFILSEIVQVMEQMEDYLLKAELLLLDPEYIYLDAENRKLFFCMIPGEPKSTGNSFRLLMENILPRIDHGRRDAVALGYGVYRLVSSDSFRLEEIKKLLYTGTERNGPAGGMVPEPENSPEPLTFSETPESSDPVISPELLYEEKERHFDRIPLRGLLITAVCFAAAAGILLLAAAGVYGWIPGISAEKILGTGTVCLGGGLLICRAFEKRTGRSENPEKITEAEDTELHGKEGKIPEREFIRPDHTEVSLFRGYEEEELGVTVFVRPERRDPAVMLKSQDTSKAPDIVPEEEITLIGKLKSACDAVLQEQTVSRIHARIRKAGDDYYLMDMNSRNGTSVNGHLLGAGEEYLLKNGDKIEFARAEYDFRQEAVGTEAAGECALYERAVDVI